MAEKIKVVSLARNTININLSKFNGKIIPINKGGFAYLSEDELAYVVNSSKAFDKGVLKVADVEKLPDGLDIPTSPNALTNEDIESILKVSQTKLPKELEAITSIDTIKKILEMATEQDKSVKFVKIIQEKLETLLGQGGVVNGNTNEKNTRGN